MTRNDSGDLFDLASMGDGEIRELILRELQAQPNLDADSIVVDVADGRVTLSGRIGTDAETSIAEHIVTDVVGVEKLDNQLVVDETQRGELPEAADSAAMAADESEPAHGAGSGQHTDTAEHLEENLEEEAWGTRDMGAAIRDGTSYSPPDRPTPDGYRSREEH